MIWGGGLQPSPRIMGGGEGRPHHDFGFQIILYIDPRTEPFSCACGVRWCVQWLSPGGSAGEPRQGLTWGSPVVPREPGGAPKGIPPGFPPGVLGTLEKI